MPKVVRDLDYLGPLFLAYDERQVKQQKIIEDYAERIDCVRKEADQAIDECINLRN